MSSSDEQYFLGKREQWKRRGVRAAGESSNGIRKYVCLNTQNYVKNKTLRNYLNCMRTWSESKLIAIYSSVDEICNLIHEKFGISIRSENISILVIGSCARVESKRVGDIDIDMIVPTCSLSGLCKEMLKELEEYICRILKKRDPNISDIDLRIKCLDEVRDKENLVKYKLGAVILHEGENARITKILRTTKLSYGDIVRHLEKLIDYYSRKGEAQKEYYKMIQLYLVITLLIHKMDNEIFRNYITLYYFLTSNPNIEINLKSQLRELENTIEEFTCYRYNNYPDKRFGEIFSNLIFKSYLEKVRQLFREQKNIMKCSCILSVWYIDKYLGYIR